MKFQKLTPTQEANLDGYSDALDFVFSDSDIRNIAISGAYSSGKSSVIESYEVKHQELKFIHISLAHFQQTESEDFKEDIQDVSEKQIEGKILNQLIQQIPSEQIPQTNFHIKRRVSLWKPFRVSALTCALIALIAYCVNFDAWSGFVTNLNASWLHSLLMFTTSPACRFCGAMLAFALFCYFIYKLVQTQYGRNIFRKISVQGNEIEIFNTDNDSFFDKYLNEVLYLFENTKADCIIFEDIDRFDNVTIFERLREINTLVNIRLGESWKNRRRRHYISTRKRINPERIATSNKEQFTPLRFFYLLRDDIFENKDRTKFFDYILPVVPVLDSSNSYDKLKQYLEDAGSIGRFSDHFLRGISLYIDDLRVLKNIYNEYLIYNAKLEGIELISDKLFAMITYKNLFPRDFAELQLNRGYVYSLFQGKTSLIVKRKKMLEEKINALNERIEYCKKEHLESLSELEWVKQKKASNNVNAYSPAAREYKEWMDNEYPKRKQAIDDRESAALGQLENSLQELQIQVDALDNSRLSELLDRDIMEEVFHGKENGKHNFNDTFKSLKEDPYFDLLKYLLSHGYIDETYFDYMSFFYPNSLSRKDKMFVRSVMDRKHKGYDYPLDDPGLIVENLNDYDYTQIETLNYDLFEYLLVKQMITPANCIIQQISSNSKMDFLEGFIRRGRALIEMSVAVAKNWPEAFSTILENQLISEHAIKVFSYKIVEGCDTQLLEDINQCGVLSEYIASDPNYLSVAIVDEAAFERGLQSLSIQFYAISIDNINRDLFKYIYENNMYHINTQTLPFMLTQVCQVEDLFQYYPQLLSSIVNNHEEPLFVYLLNNINDALSSYFELYNGAIVDPSDVVAAVINIEELSRELKDKYISHLETRVSKLEDINKPEDMQLLLKYDAVEYSAANILFYHQKFGLTDELVQFINSDIKDLDYLQEGDLATDKFVEDCLQCNSIDNNKYRQILHNLCEPIDVFDEEKLSEDHALILFDLNIIPMNENNLNFIRKTYPQLVYDYIRIDIPGYLKLAESAFLLEEVITLLEWNSISDNQKIELLQYTNQPIKLADHSYSDKLVIHILQSNFDVSDVPWLAINYDEKSGKVKDTIYKMLLNNVNVIVQNRHNLCPGLRKQILSDTSVDRVYKLKLLEQNASQMSHTELEEILIQMGGNKIANNLDGKTQRVEYNTPNEELLTSLYASGIIRKPELDKTGKYYLKIKYKLSTTNDSIPREIL